jgi:hypothetical protein
LAALLSEAVSVSLEESCDRFVMTCGEPGAAGGGGDGGGAVGAGFCEAHPMASAVARIAALVVTAAQSQQIVAAARTLAQNGVVKPYRIAFLAEKNLVIALVALARDREAHDFNTEAPG